MAVFSRIQFGSSLFLLDCKHFESTMQVCSFARLGLFLSCARIVLSDSSSPVVAAAHVGSSPLVHSFGYFGSSHFLLDFTFLGLRRRAELCAVWDRFCRVLELSEVTHPRW